VTIVTFLLVSCGRVPLICQLTNSLDHSWKNTNVLDKYRRKSLKALFGYRQKFRHIGQEAMNFTVVFYVLLTVHIITVFVNNQLAAQFFFLYLFIPILYMYRATNCSSSGETIVSIRPLIYVNLCRAVCRLKLRTTRSPTQSDT